MSIWMSKLESANMSVQLVAKDPDGFKAHLKYGTPVR